MKSSYQEINCCRICSNEQLVPIVNLGSQVLSGIFPDSTDQAVPITPLELVKCHSVGDSQICGLVQLRHSANVEEMYGATYGYYSSLSSSMVRHLQCLIEKLKEV